MKIRTRDGEVEMTSEMVRRGMVFHSANGIDVTVTEAVRGAWRTQTGGCIVPVGEHVGWTLLGCDPAIAARADCEVYGIAPGIDAGAAGFARLPTGGAVDLRRESVDGVVATAPMCDRFTIRAPSRLGPLGRFIGLDARYARPEDVARLCCGAADPDDSQTRCTLAIGHDGKHEDIVTRLRWGGARAADRARTGSVSIEDLADAFSRAVLGSSQADSGSVTAAHAEARKSAQITVTPPARLEFGPALLRRSDDPATRRVLETPDPAAARRASEAALVALVAAVPEGLDPVGWRAAVLAVRERPDLAPSLTLVMEQFARFKRGERAGQVDGVFVAWDAYRRAIAAPGPRPTPERKRGGRDVRLAVDDGRDE